MIRPPWRRRPPQEPGLTAHDGRTGGHAGATHYATLGVTRDARATDIVRAYRRLAKHHHPDVSVGTAGADAFKRASAAYDVLSDPARRSAYDASLDAAAAAAAPQRRVVLGASRSETTMLIALAVLACVGLLYILVFALGYREDGQAGTPPTDEPAATGAPSPSAAPAAGGVPSASPSASPSPVPIPTTSSPAQSTPVPATASPQPTTPTPTAIPTPSLTATLTPSPNPTPSPVTPPPATQPPATQPPPTATPTRCLVPNVIGMRRNSVQATWVGAGFGTLVNFLPGQGNYVVATQNLGAGTTAPCATTTLTVGP